MLDEEKNYYSSNISLIAGVDEAGRGPWAGPVYAAAVVFPKDYINERINDSKKLTIKAREELFDEIKENALSYGIAFSDATTIDSINILEATKKAMKEAISQLDVPIELILTDATKLEGLVTPVIPIIKGDAKCLNIAAASILAKVSRDRYMYELERIYPMFSFSKHKGYGTKQHLEELEKHGPIKDVHRMSYKPIKSLLKLNLFTDFH